MSMKQMLAVRVGSDDGRPLTKERERVGEFAYDPESGELIGPRQYMEARGIPLIREMSGHKNEISSLSRYFPYFGTGVLMVMMFDHADWSTVPPALRRQKRVPDLVLDIHEW